MRKLYFVVLLLLIFTSSAFSISGSTNISSEIYSFETDSLKHYQFYQSLQSRINVFQQDLKLISFSTYGRWRTDTESSITSTQDLFIYNFQINLKGFVKSSNFSAGRQYVYSAVGSALIDGVSLKTTLISNSELTINAGSEVNRLEADKIQNLSNNLIVVSRYQYEFDKKATIGLNWFLKKNNNQVTTNRVGLDVLKKIEAYSLYSRVTYNISISSLSEILLRTSYRYDKWYLSIEGRYREPLVNSNTLFAIIDSEKYKRIRFDTQYKLNKKTRLHSQIRYALYEDDNSLSGSFGISTAIFSIFYNFQMGRGTENNGLSGTVTHKLNKSISLYGTANISRYKIQDDYDELSDAYSTAFGGVKTFAQTWKIQAEIQFLRNAVESSNSRIYAKLSKQFLF